jgi:hypothetical protein
LFFSLKGLAVHDQNCHCHLKIPYVWTSIVCFSVLVFCLSLGKSEEATRENYNLVYPVFDHLRQAEENK